MGVRIAQLRWKLDASRRAAGLALTRIGRAFTPTSRVRLVQFLFAPPDLRTSDPTVAADIYAGQFVFAGRAVATNGLSPYDVEPPSAGWAEALYGFGWLRHLQAANTALARNNARTLVSDFLRRGRSLPPVARKPAVAARRLMALLAQSPMMLEGADHDFYTRYLAGVRQDARLLRDARRRTDDPVIRLAASVALTQVGLCVEGAERLERRFGLDLSDLLDEQVLADGGHVTRNPRVLVDLMLDLLPLRSTYAARGMEAPRGIVSAIDRLAPHLRMLRHPDGSIALFNGMGASQVDALATIFASHDTGGRGALDAPYSGYQRLEAGDSVLIVDSGPAPPFAASGEAMAGCQSFEFSHGRQRIFVNCGVPRQATAELRVELRATAAHTAVSYADTSSCRFIRRGDETRILSGPRQVTASRAMTEAGDTLSMTHDGYQAAFGLETLRELVLSRDGALLMGTEQVRGRGLAAADKALTARFHLHPSVRAEIAASGVVILSPPRGRAWRFSSPDAAPMLEDSAFFAGIDGARRTQQIVLTAQDLAKALRWRLDQVEDA